MSVVRLYVNENEHIVMIEDEDGWRWYEFEGVKYISVTQVLSVVMHEKLKFWFIKNSQNKIQKTVKTAADMGTKIHAAIEADCKGQGMLVDGDIDGPYSNWLKLKEERLVIYESEMYVFSKRYGYAGKLDLLGDFDKKISVMDIKTGRFDIKTGWQLAAYKQAYEEMNNITGLGMVGLHIPRDGNDIKTYVYEHYDWCLDTFLSCLQVWKGLYFNKLHKMQWPFLKRECHEVKD